MCRGIPSGKDITKDGENIDTTEQLSIDRACKLFNCNYANVQPHSGASANTAVQLSICKAGDFIIGMSLNSDGHLTHGTKPTYSGKNYISIQYEVNPETYLIHCDEIEKLALNRLPRLLICRSSAYSRTINFEKFREIVVKINEIILEDIKDDYNRLKVLLMEMIGLTHIMMKENAINGRQCSYSFSNSKYIFHYYLSE